MLSTHHHVHQGPSPKDGIVSSVRMRAMIRPSAASCAVSRNDLRSGSIRARRAAFPPIRPCLKSTRAESAPNTESNSSLPRTNAPIVATEVLWTVAALKVSGPGVLHPIASASVTPLATAPNTVGVRSGIIPPG